jgi:catechol 2,3-dioxygenase-like lactoylglutathione lyase family enzyme
LPVLSHVFVGITDFPRALAFYTGIMTTLGLELKFSDPEIPWAGWKQPTADRPLLLIGHAYNGEPANPGNGQMIALLAKSRDIVGRSHAAALANGGKCEGPPGLRPHYHPNYYGAYFRDPDGNKLCVCCHQSE